MKIVQGEPDKFAPFTIHVGTARERDALVHALEVGMSETSSDEDDILLPAVNYMRDRQQLEERAARIAASR